jgi:hypothetical protein
MKIIQNYNNITICFDDYNVTAEDEVYVVPQQFCEIQNLSICKSETTFDYGISAAPVLSIDLNLQFIRDYFDADTYSFFNQLPINLFKEVSVDWYRQKTFNIPCVITYNSSNYTDYFAIENCKLKDNVLSCECTNLLYYILNNINFKDIYTLCFYQLYLSMYQVNFLCYYLNATEDSSYTWNGIGKNSLWTAIGATNIDLNNVTSEGQRGINNNVVVSVVPQDLTDQQIPICKLSLFFEAISNFVNQIFALMNISNAFAMPALTTQFYRKTYTQYQQRGDAIDFNDLHIPFYWVLNGGGKTSRINEFFDNYLDYQSLLEFLKDLYCADMQYLIYSNNNLVRINNKDIINLNNINQNVFQIDYNFLKNKNIQINFQSNNENDKATISSGESNKDNLNINLIFHNRISLAPLNYGLMCESSNAGFTPFNQSDATNKVYQFMGKCSNFLVNNSKGLINSFNLFYLDTPPNAKEQMAILVHSYCKPDMITDIEMPPLVESVLNSGWQDLKTSGSSQCVSNDSNCYKREKVIIDDWIIEHQNNYTIANYLLKCNEIKYKNATQFKISCSEQYYQDIFSVTNFLQLLNQSYELDNYVLVITNIDYNLETTELILEGICK